MNQLLHVNTAWWDDNIRFLIRCKPEEIHCELLAVTVLDSAATRERATVAVSMRKKNGLIWFWLFCNYRVRDISSTFQLLLLSFLTPDERSRDVEILSWKSSVTSLHHVHRLWFTTADYLYLKWLFSSPHTHTHTPTAAEKLLPRLSLRSLPTPAHRLLLLLLCCLGCSALVPTNKTVKTPLPFNQRFILRLSLSVSQLLGGVRKKKKKKQKRKNPWGNKLSRGV